MAARSFREALVRVAARARRRGETTRGRPRSSPRLEVEVDRRDRVVACDGDVDTHTAPLVAEALAALHGTGEITVDLGSVAFIDSSGLQLLVAAHRRQADEGGRLVVRAPSDPVRRVLAIAELDEYLDVR